MSIDMTRRIVLFVGTIFLSLSQIGFIPVAQASDVSFKPAGFAAGTKKTEIVSGILNKPDGAGPFPAIVLLHGRGGMTTQTSNFWPRYFNRIGYVTLSIDSLSSRGNSRSDWGIKDQRLDAYGGLDFLAALPFVDGKRVGVIGFSAGGRTVNKFVHGQQRESDNGLSFKAAISFYGNCGLIRFEKKSLPLMMLVGELETNKRLKDCLVDHPGTNVEVHMLKDAYHAFDDQRFTSLRTSRGGNQMQYNHAARLASEELVKQFLTKNLKNLN